MSEIREALQAQLANFDEDAFVALANRGLLRRAQKDLEKIAIEVAEDSDTALRLTVGEHTVGFDARGPAQAKCSCPAGGVCQHILCAALSLQRDAQVAQPAKSTEVPVEVSAPAPSDVVQEDSGAEILPTLSTALLTIGQDELIKHAGRAGYRWAWQYVQDLDLESGLIIGGERNIVIGLRHPRVTFRYMGGMLESMVADLDSAHVAKQRVAAVLAYQKANGMENAPLEKAEKTGKSGALDLGKDHALLETESQVRQESRARLFASATSLLQDCLELGLSHLSKNMQERFATLAVWAQGADCFRLALLVRRIADHVESLLERAGAADEHRLFDEITLAYGLIAAIEAAAAKDSVPRHLTGLSRTRYEQSATLELLGVGAYPWRTPSGYVGLTMLFWSERDHAFLSCGDARPEVQRSFNPIARYNAAGPWSGMGAPAVASGKLVRLANPLLNEQGRLSATEKTSADFRPAEGLHGRLTACRDWATLEAERSAARRSLLAQPDPMRDWVALVPETTGPARFDVNRQMLLWPLFDANGRCIDVELNYSDYTEHAIARIEQLAQDGLPTGSLLIVQLRDSNEGLKAFPLSLVPAGDNKPLDVLHFDAAPSGKPLSRWLTKLREGKPKTFTQAAAIDTQRHMLPVLELRRYLQAQAERGVPGERAKAVEAELAAHIERLNAHGFVPAGKLATAELAPSLLLMRLNYLCLQYEKFGNATGQAGLEDT